MLQAFIRLTLSAALSIGSLLGGVWQMTNSDPPTLSIEVRGAGQVDVEQDKHHWSCKNQNLLIPLPDQIPITLIAKAEEGEQIEQFQIDEQEIPEAIGQNRFKLTRTIRTNTSIQIRFSQSVKEQEESGQSEQSKAEFNEKSESENDSSASRMESSENSSDSDRSSSDGVLGWLEKVAGQLSAGFGFNQNHTNALNGQDLSDEQSSGSSAWEENTSKGEDSEHNLASDLSDRASLQPETTENETIENETTENGEDSQQASTSLSSSPQSNDVQNIHWAKLEQLEVELFYHEWHLDYLTVYSNYQQGNESEFQDFRKAFARKCEVENWLDEAGFLPAEFFEQTESIPGYLQVFNPTDVKTPAPRARMKAQAKAMTPNTGGVNGSVTITDARLYSQVPAFAGYTMSNHLWTLDNGCQAFCANAPLSEPATGEKSISVEPCTNTDVRKALYYGYGGPGNIFGGYSASQQIIFTNEMVSHAYANTSISETVYDNAIWNGGMKDRWNEVKNKPDPPARYKVYIAHFAGTGKNYQGHVVTRQPLAFGFLGEDDKGAFQLIKSVDTSTGGLANSAPANYSLTGAVYEYGEGSKSSPGRTLGTLTIGSDGCSQVVELKPGTYWVKEKQAPKGYALDPNYYEVIVTAGSSTAAPNRIVVRDKAQGCKAELLVVKTDKRTHQPLANAVFEVKFYNLDPSKANASEVSRAKPVVSKTYRTDGQGRISVPNQILPIGVLTIQEIEAPTGYRMDDTLHIIALDPKGSTSEIFMTLDPVQVSNEPIASLVLYKKTMGSDLPLSGAQFILQSPSGNRTTITVSEQGQKLILDENGTWTLKESRAPDGYTAYTRPISIQVNGSTVRCTVPDDHVEFNENTFELTVFNETGGYTLQIHKVDDQNQPLAGAVFGLYEDLKCSKKIDEGTTDDQGRLDFGPLKAGENYYLSEIRPPAGYLPMVNASGRAIVLQISAVDQGVAYTFKAPMTISVEQEPESTGKNPYVFWKKGSLPSPVLHGKFVNKKKVTLPKTGSWHRAGVVISGSLLMIGALLSGPRKKHSKDQST